MDLCQNLVLTKFLYFYNYKTVVLELLQDNNK